MRLISRRAVCAGAGSLAISPSTLAKAQSPAGFYSGKTLTIIVGSSPGGYYDIAARVVARNLGSHLLGHPNVVVQNIPGAGGLALGNRLANTLPRDGTTIVAMNRGLPQLALVGDKNALFDPLELTWLGSLSSYKDDGYLLLLNARHEARSIDDLRKLQSPVHLGGTRAGATNIIFALIARDILKLNIELIRGFPGAAEIWLAMERGEMDGQMVDISAILVGRPRPWKKGKFRPFVAFGRLERLDDHPAVPVARELVSDPDDLALLDFAELPFFMALPFVAPPGLPLEQATMLRSGFMSMATSDEFRTDMKRSGILTSPIDGLAVRALIERAAAAPRATRERFARLLVQ